MSHAASRPTSSHAQQQQGTRARIAPAPAPPVQTYYDDDLDCNDCNSETECETPSDRSQDVAKRTAAAAEQVYKQMYYQRPDVQYVPTTEFYYGASSRVPYRYGASAGQTFAPIAPATQLRKTHLIPANQLPRVCTTQPIPASSLSPVAPPMHPFYQQPQYSIPQPSYDCMQMSYDGMQSVPVSQVPGGHLYQHAHRHSTHHLQVPMMPPSNRFRPSLHTASAANIRPINQSRKPITVHTPRYIRRPGTSSALYKKPSALCIPLACQPDPAVNPRRQAKPVDNLDQDHQLRINKLPPHQSGKRVSSKNQQQVHHKLQQPSASLTAELQPTLSQSQLDALFANYEELYLKATTQGLGQSQPKGKIMATMMGLGPPRVPLHIQKRRQELLRAKQQQQQQQLQQEKVQVEILRNNVAQDRGDSKEQNKSFSIPKDAETFDVQEITSQVLQDLMSDMSTTNDMMGMAENIGAMGDKMADEILNDTDTTDNTKHNVVNEHIDKTLINLHGPAVRNRENRAMNETLPESFNYQDISQNISKSKSAFQEEDEDDASTVTQKQSTIASQINLKSEVESQTGGQIRRLTSQKSIKSLKCSRVTNVAEAMELHRTKSYVVNLIDTALSNHFGTSVCDKYSSYECSGLNPANLIETLKKHSVPKLEKDVCIEIAQALNQTYSNFNTSAEKVAESAAQDNSKQDSCCSCKGESAEPTYIKYLRQLRWGHLKHIQAEAKRLEELERFFDSCSKKAFCEKYP